jgi:hypothetical protein
MARALSNRQFRESTGPVDQSAHEANRPLEPRPRGMRPPAQDWMSEFPQEPATPHEPAMWVEVPHAPIAPPPHTEFRPFSPAGWIRSHRSLARTGALALAVISAGLLGLAAWMQRERDQTPSDVTQSATSERLSRPSVTPPAAPPTVFTSQAAPATAASAISQPAAREGESAAVTKSEPARTAAALDRAKTPPARTTAPPPARVAGATSGRATASSPSSSTTSGRFVPPLPPAIPPPARPPAAQTPKPVTDASSLLATSTVTTSRPPVDRAPLILSSPALPPAASPVPTSAPAPAPPLPPSPEARETAAVETLLERYRLAFSTLNSGVSDFWPGVNSRALDKAFNELEQQRFEFNQCRVQLNGAQAEATCTGTATFVPKVGNKTPRTQSRLWSFRLVRAGNRWIIDSVQSR